MAQPYLDQLKELVKKVKQDDLECKHFFSGAACYVNRKMFASLTPGGFALKLPEETRSKLMGEGGSPLRYFPKAPVKKEYVVLTKEMMTNSKTFRHLIKISMKYSQEEKV